MRRRFLLTFILLPLMTFAQNIALPKLCKPCLFYGGDLDPSNPNSNAFWNESTLADPLTSTFGSITVPKGRILLIQGILFQTLFVFTDQLDPAQATWQIRTGDINDNGGTLVASGSGVVVMQPTGRLFNGGQSQHGTPYWFNLTPLCTNQQDSGCLSAQYYVTNTATLVNAYRGHAQSGAYATIYSPGRGYQWDNLCQLGFTGCADLSFGLMGKVVQ
jgi:hypothetical protein